MNANWLQITKDEAIAQPGFVDEFWQAIDDARRQMMVIRANDPRTDQEIDRDELAQRQRDDERVRREESTRSDWR